MPYEPVLLARVNKPNSGKLESYRADGGYQTFERVLKDNELLISEWAPIHLARVMRDWFWKDDVKEAGALNVWQQSCQQLYLPRLKDDTVFYNTMAAGAESREFFGIAQGKEDDRYVGFSYGKRTSLIMDASLLLIEPIAAAVYMEQLRAAEEASRAQAAGATSGTATTTSAGESTPLPAGTSSGSTHGAGTSTASQTVNRRFYGVFDLDPIQAKRQFADLADEVVQQFTVRPGVNVTITVEIQAESSAGFDAGIQRAVTENCTTLKFGPGSFEPE